MPKKEMASIEETLVKDFMEGRKKEMLAIIDTRGMKATGESARAIEYKVIVSSGKVTGIMYGPEHIEFMERGRGPGKFPPPNKIKDWIRAKGIRPNGITIDQLAYLIGRKMSIEGSVLHRTGQRSGIISSALNRSHFDKFFGQYFEKKTASVTKSIADKLFER